MMRLLETVYCEIQPSAVIAQFLHFPRLTLASLAKIVVACNVLVRVARDRLARATIREGEFYSYNVPHHNDDV